MIMFNPAHLRPGDHLLYGAHDFTGWLTGLKTWSPAVHIEIDVGKGKSVASRNGLGVELYDYRPGQLIAVLEPRQTINLDKALRWFNEPFDHAECIGVRGRPYGWLDLLRFFNVRRDTPGWICSQFACLFDHAGDFHPFNDEYANGSVAPGDFFLSNAFAWKWVHPDARKAVARF